MSQKRIESTIAFCKPTPLNELQSFMGVVNYFKDHLRYHSAVAKLLYEMVALATKQKTKTLSWTAEGYAHGAYLCQIRTLTDGTTVEERIRFLGGTFQGPQTRWSTIEKEAYAICWALLRLDDLVGGVHFTIRTDHRNLLFMNNHGSRKVLQWKLDIQHYNATIEHVAGKANTLYDVF